MKHRLLLHVDSTPKTALFVSKKEARIAQTGEDRRASRRIKAEESLGLRWGQRESGTLHELLTHSLDNSRHTVWERHF